MAKPMLRIDSCVRFYCQNILFLRTICGEGSPWPVLKILFRCCGEIPLVNQKLTFDELISCITRHDDFHREVIGQFHCELLLSSETGKAEATVAIYEPVKPNGKRVNYGHLIQVNLK